MRLSMCVYLAYSLFEGMETDVEDIGLKDETIYVRLSEPADSIKVTGQDHRTLLLALDTDGMEYAMAPEDSYARITAYFPDGEVIYTNPVARYDSSLGPDPFDGPDHRVNLPLTILYNLVLLVLAAGTVFLMIKLIRK